MKKLGVFGLIVCTSTITTAIGAFALWLANRLEVKPIEIAVAEVIEIPAEATINLNVKDIADSAAGPAVSLVAFIVPKMIGRKIRAEIIRQLESKMSTESALRRMSGKPGLNWTIQPGNDGALKVVINNAHELVAAELKSQLLQGFAQEGIKIEIR